MISKNTHCLWRSLIFFYTISCGGNLKGAIFDKKLFGNTLSPHQSTDILSLDSSPGVPQSTLLETAFSTPSTKQAKLLFVPVYAYLSVFRSHPILPHNKHLSTGCYDYGSVPRPFLTHVPGESPHHEWCKNDSQYHGNHGARYDPVGKPPPKGTFLPAWHCNEW